MLKGCTGKNNIALQITVDDYSDVEAYMDTLERLGAYGTFFFCEQCDNANGATINEVLSRGHGVGFYVCNTHEGRETDMYIGNGYSVPVMSCGDGSQMRRIGPSIDFEKLRSHKIWQQILQDSIQRDMFIRIKADNEYEDFEKVVQIIRDKGYRITSYNVCYTKLLRSEVQPSSASKPTPVVDASKSASGRIPQSDLILMPL